MSKLSRIMHRILFIIILLSLSVFNIKADNDCVIDSADTHQSWVRQLIDNGFHINDPNINYPAAIKKFVDIYDWADRTFNSYDTAYVVGTGKNWKATLNNLNWSESYTLVFGLRSNAIAHIQSDFYNDIGCSVSFMAVSLGYTYHTKNWRKTVSGQSNFNFSFTTSRFAANIESIKTSGNCRISKFGDYKFVDNKPIRFNGTKHNSFTAELYYFFNNRKYSQAAAYCFSKYQLKSAGSAMLGLSYINQKIDLDFSSLSEEMKQQLPYAKPEYKFHYTDYLIAGGYAYNWCIRPRKWLFNISLLPAIGIRRNHSDSTPSKKYMLGIAGNAKTAIVYNYKNIYASLNVKLNGNVIFANDFAFANSIQSYSIIFGARF